MKTVLITGASSGIGEQMAEIFASKKARVILVARSEDKLHQIADSLKANYACEAFVIKADLTQSDQVIKVYEQCKANNWHVDYLINNAGFGDSGHFAEIEWSIFDAMIDLNMKSVAHLCHLFIPDMRKHGFGRILNVASLAAFMPGPYMSVYYASKAFVLHFSEALSLELQEDNISVTALCPGPTDTGFQSKAHLDDKPLFNETKVATARSVAKFGFKAMMNGWRVAIPGIQNMLLAKASRWAPRGLVINTVKRFNK